MGIPLDVFSLYSLQGEGAGCRHHLLLRVARRGFSNADQRDYERAVAAAGGAVSALIEVYKAGPLADECAAPHAANLVGESQARPVGDELSEGAGGFYLDLWVAETRYGHPWVVLGTAGSEEAFWREVGRDEDLASLGARGPARLERVFFLTQGARADV